MLQTLFYIPDQIAGYPMFGAGLLLAVWAVASVAGMAWLVWRQGWNADTWSYVPLLLLIGAIIWLVLPRIIERDHGLPIRGYGMMLLLAVVSGTGLAIWRARRVGVDPDLILSLLFWGFLPGIIGARLFYVIEYWEHFRQPTLGETLGGIVNITQGGLVVYGSFIGGMLGFAAFFWKYKLPPLATLDLVVPSMLLGLAIGRIGCLLNGCCFGGACDLPWAVRFPQGSPPYMHQVQHGKIFVQGLKVLGDPEDPAVVTEVEPGSLAEAQGLKAGQKLESINGRRIDTVEDAQRRLFWASQSGDSIEIKTEGRPAVRYALTPLPARSGPVHPTQLYQSIDALILCLFLLAYDPFRRRDGELLALLLTLYPINRFLMEFIRTDEPGVLGTHLTIGQVISLLLLATGVGLWFYILRRPARKAFAAFAA